MLDRSISILTWRTGFAPITVVLLLLPLLLLLSATTFASIQYGSRIEVLRPSLLSREDLAGQTRNATDIYGLGVRLGSYCQALAFIVGFLNLLRWRDKLDPKSQFAGVVLTFSLLIRWWVRRDAHQISIPEMWCGLAQILAISAPGLVLVYLGFAYQSTTWHDQENRKERESEVVRGQGLTLLQIAIVLFWSCVINMWFAYWVIMKRKGAGYPGQAGAVDVLWVLGTHVPSSVWVKAFMIAQAMFTTLVEIPPFLWYYFAWLQSIRVWWGWKQPDALDGILHNWILLGPTEDEGAVFRSSKTHHLWPLRAASICFIASIIYVGFIVISIERTIVVAKLEPYHALSDPSQLLPLVTGSIALTTALGSLSRPVTEEPEKIHRYANGEVRIYTRVGYERRR